MRSCLFREEEEEKYGKDEGGGEKKGGGGYEGEGSKKDSLRIRSVVIAAPTATCDLNYYVGSDITPQNSLLTGKPQTPPPHWR